MLSVDAGKMRRIDTRNVENLFGMWSVFSKCADSMEDGRRLENLSWRVWNREVLCCEPQPQLATTPAVNITRSRPSKADVPELSASVDSALSDASDDEEGPQQSQTGPVAVPSDPSGTVRSIQSTSRGKEKHITSVHLEKMVSDIQEQEERPWPLPASITNAIPPVRSATGLTPRPMSPSLHASIHSSESSASTAPRSSPESDRSAVGTVASDTSAEILSSSHSVVRGFSPNVSSSYRSNTHLAAPQPSAMPIHHKKVSEASKLNVAFSLGGGNSSGDEASSFEDRMSGQQSRHSSLTAGLRRPLHAKKQTSFKDELESRTLNHKSHQDEEVFEDSDEESESAIEDEDDDDDDDGSDWEDDGSDSGEGADDTPLFKRIDSKPNLVSRRSLLTTMMNENDRAAAFRDMASQSTSALRRSRRSSPNGPTLGDATEDDVTLPPTMTKSKPIIMTTSNTHPPALSPRTTRRNMLATEMTESLRKHLLWERQQISTTAKAVLKRRHTAYDVTKLSEYPGEKEGQASKNNSWNHFYDQGGEYNHAGW